MAKRIDAEPKQFLLDPQETALVIVDMQRDFVLPDGWAGQRNDTTHVQKAIRPIKRMLETARSVGMPIIFTREGHKPDLSDAPQRKIESLPKGNRIGDKGPMGRLLIRGEHGHDIIDELKPQKGETVIDKSGKDAFYKTRLNSALTKRGIKNVLFVGVTTNCCIHASVIGAHDRGYHPIVLRDCVAAYNQKLHRAALQMIPYEAGIFGSVTHSKHIRNALAKPKRRKKQSPSKARR